MKMKSWSIKLLTTLSLMLSLFPVNVVKAEQLVSSAGSYIGNSETISIPVDVNSYSSVLPYSPGVSWTNADDSNSIRMVRDQTYTTTYPVNYLGKQLTAEVGVTLIDDTNTYPSRNARAYLNSNKLVEVGFRDVVNAQVRWDFKIYDANDGNKSYLKYFIFGICDPDESDYYFETDGRVIFYSPYNSQAASMYYYTSDGFLRAPNCTDVNGDYFYISMKDEEIFSFTSNTTDVGGLVIPYLYAGYYKVNYLPNYPVSGGSGSMSTQYPIAFTKETQVLENQYTLPDYQFIGWSTKPDKEEGTFLGMNGKFVINEPGSDDNIFETKVNTGDTVNLYAQWQYTGKVKKFALEKTWENDNEDIRPSSISVIIDGSDGSSYNYSLSEANNWKRLLYLPAYNGSTEITYTYHEVIPTGYISESGSPVSLRSVTTYEPSENVYSHDDGYVIRREGFDTVAVGDYVLVSDLSASNPNNTRSFTTDNYKFVAGAPAYNNWNESKGYTLDCVCYEGNLTRGVNHIPGSFTATYGKALKDAYGAIYDLQLTISDLDYYVGSTSESGAGNYQISILCYDPTTIFLQNFYLKKKTGGLGVKYNLSVKVLDENGNEADGSVQLLITDLDVMDYSDTGDPSYRRTYAESVEPLSGVNSAMFLSQNSYLQVFDNNRFVGSRTTTGEAEEYNSGVLYTGKASGNSLIYRANTDVGTALKLNQGWGSIDPTLYNNKMNNKGYARANIVYFDATTGETLYSETLSGIPTTQINYDPTSRINSYINAHYALVENPFEVTQYYPAEGETTIEIVLQHTYDYPRESSVVKRTINYVYEDGHTPAPFPQVVQSTTFFRNGVKDLVTNITEWDDWNKTSDQFSEVISTPLTGYLISKDKVGQITVTKDTEDIIETIVYTPITYSIVFDPNAPLYEEILGETEDMQNLRYDKSYDLSENGYANNNYRWISWNTQSDGLGFTYTDQQTVKNLTTTNNQTVVLYAQWDPNMTANIVYRDVTDPTSPERLGNIDSVTGVPGAKVDYDPSQRINELIDAHYLLQTNPFEEEIYYPYGSTHLEKVYYIDFVRDIRKIVDDEEISATIERTIDYVYSNKEGSPFEEVKQSASFSREGTIDLVTDEKTFGPWVPDSAVLQKVESPSLVGYKPDKLRVDQITVTAESENLQELVTYSPITYTIRFNPNWTKEEGSGTMADIEDIEYDETVTLNENQYLVDNYIWQNWNTKADGSGQKYTDKQQVSNLTVVDNDIIDLYAIWEPIMYTQINVIDRYNGVDKLLEEPTIINGSAGEKIDYDTSDIIAYYESLGYKVIVNPFENEVYQPEGRTSQSQQINIVLTEKEETLQQKAVVKRTIKYVQEGSTKAPLEPVEQMKTFIKTGLKNLVTGEITWNDWDVKEATLAKVESPHLAYYKPDKSIVPEVKITPESLDELETVTYTLMKYNIKYNPNGAKGSPYLQEIYYTKSSSIEKNKFESTCTFVGWNTQENGKGKDYKPQQEIMNLASGKENEEENLYAQWSCPQEEPVSPKMGD